MMINKNRFRVSNDKKVLHKIGKRWVTVSALTLALLGGGALAGSVTTHAASTQPQTQAPASATPKGIMKTASAMHSNMLNNAQKLASSTSAKSSVARQSAFSASSEASSSNDATNTFALDTLAQQQRGWNYVQHGINHDDYDKTVAKPKFNPAYEQYMKDNPDLVNIYNNPANNQPTNNTSRKMNNVGSDTVYHTNDSTITSYNLNKSSDEPIFSGETQREIYLINNGNLKTITTGPNQSVDVSNDGKLSQITIGKGTTVYYTPAQPFEINWPQSFISKALNENLWENEAGLSADANLAELEQAQPNQPLYWGPDISTISNPQQALQKDIQVMPQSDKQYFEFPYLVPAPQMPTKWYLKNPKDDYTSATPVNLLDGNTYKAGTYVTTKNPAPITSIINYQNNGKTISSFSLSNQKAGASISDKTINAHMPSDYELTDPSQQFTAQNNVDVPVDINYQKEIDDLNKKESADESTINTDSSKITNDEATINSNKKTINSDTNKINNDESTINSDNTKISDANKEINDLKNDGSITLAFSVGDQVVSGNQGKYITLDDAEVRQQPKYNNSSDTYDITSLLKNDIPTGYHINGNVYAKVQPLNDGFAQILLQSSQSHVRSMLGATRRPLIKLGSFRGFGAEQSGQQSYQNHVIPVVGNSVTYSGNVTLNYNANGKPVNSITVPYSVSSEVGSDVTLLNPNNYLNKTLKNFDTHHYLANKSNDYHHFTVSANDAPNDTNPTHTQNYTLNFDAQNVKDHITYEVSGSNIPHNFQGKTSGLNYKDGVYTKTVSDSGTFDTGISSDTINSGVPANYNIVSGNTGLNYDNNSHVIQIAPKSETVSINYKDTDNNGKIIGTNPLSDTYSQEINVPYNTKISDVTKSVDIPNGYQYVSGPKSYIVNGNNSQSDTLNVKGHQETNNVTVTINKIDRGQNVGSSTQTVQVSGATGTNYSINSNDSRYKPAGYATESGVQTGMFEPNNSLSKPTMTFNYNAQQGGSITVNYINQDNNTISDTISGLNTDDTGNISDKAPVPDGYFVNSNQPKTYRVQADGQTINIHITGKLAKDVDKTNNQGQATIYINKMVGGKSISNQPIKVDLSGKRVGDNFTIDPAKHIPNGYSCINPKKITGSVTKDGLSTDSNSQAQMTFNYSAKQGATINVTYLNQHGANVGNGQINDYVDSKGDVTKKVPLSSDYTMNSGQNTSYTVTTNPQDLTYKVTGKPASSTINFINQNNNSAGSENVSGDVGDTVSPTQYPKGYELPKGASAPQYTFVHQGGGEDKNPAEDGVKLQGKLASDMNDSKAKNAPKDAANAYATITIVEKSTTGKQLHTSTQYISENKLHVGDNGTINPTDAGIQPSGYDNDSSNRPLNFTITPDGALSNGSATFTYTVDASNIEPISITYQNQHGKYIDFNTGNVESVPNSNLASYFISSNDLAKLGNAGDYVDITNLLKAPRGYHFKAQVLKDITDANGNPLSHIQLVRKPLGSFSAMPLMLRLWTPAPKPNSNANKPSSSASAKSSSASVAPSSKASSASSSANVVPSSASSVAPSFASQSVAPSASSATPSSVAPQSTSASAPVRQVIDHGYVAPTNNETPSDTEVQPSDITPAKPVHHSHANSNAPVVHNHTQPSVQPTNQPGRVIEPKNTGKASVEPKAVREANVHAAKVQHEAASHMADVGNALAQPTVHAADIHASHVNAGSVQHQSTQHKLPQTNEAKAAGLMGAASIMAALGLAGADTDRKRRHN